MLPGWFSSLYVEGMCGLTRADRRREERLEMYSDVEVQRVPVCGFRRAKLRGE